MKRLGMLLLGTCRTVYCWLFFLGSAFGIHYLVSTGIHEVDKVGIDVDVVFAVYSLVWGIAWWKIFRGKPASVRWAIAANLVLIFHYAPVLVSGAWRGFLEAERQWWPVILIGTAGILIFSTPYHGWRSKSQMMPLEAKKI